MITYLDVPSGISGDMLLGCLVDGGWPWEALCATVEQLRLPPGSWQIAADSVMRGPLRATRVSVKVIQGDRHRHRQDISALIEASGLPAKVQGQAVDVTRLAQADAVVHGTKVEEVHFHEVGALDAIIDVTGACMGLHELGVEQLYASSVPLGEGWTTLGVRFHPVSRQEARRTCATVVTVYGPVQVKIKWVEGMPVGAKPEHDDCVRLAHSHKVPLRLVHEAAQAAAHRELLGKGAEQ